MMHDFKVGDVVIRNQGWYRDMEVGHTDTIIDLPLDGSVTLAKYGPAHCMSSLGILVANEPLPPVPDSVVYFNSYAQNHNTQHMVVETDKNEGGEIVRLSVVRNGHKYQRYVSPNVLGIHLDPDSALQLAHDLTRMAMELKRKQEKD